MKVVSKTKIDTAKKKVINSRVIDIMKTERTRKTISVRELTRNMRSIARQVNYENQEFQVTKNSEPLFIIIPNKQVKKVGKKYNIQDVLNLAIKDHLWTKEEMKLDLNTRIDNLLYGQ